MLSLDDLDLSSACEKPFEFEYIAPDGSASGVFLQVLGNESSKVSAAVDKIEDERTRKLQLLAARSKVSRPGEVLSLPQDEERGFLVRKAAVRIVGWRGIKEPYSEDGAQKLCRSNFHLAAQALEVSATLENFTKGSPKPSSSSPGPTSN